MVEEPTWSVYLLEMWIEDFRVARHLEMRSLIKTINGSNYKFVCGILFD